MANHRPRKFRLRLRELMQERRWTQTRVAQESGLSTRRVGLLVRDAWAELSRDEMEALCESFRVSPSDLFVEPDVFAGARARCALTLHINCRWTRGGRGSRQRGRAEALSFNAWDLEAALLVYRFATELGMRVRFVTHRPEESPADAGIDELFPEGTHVVIGSQLTGNLTERAVAAMHGARPFDESERDRFPMHIAWDAKRIERSAFGYTASPEAGRPLGIYSREGRQIAKRKDVLHGFGHDCGLIVLYRGDAPRAPAGQANGADTAERSIIVLAGHGGPGTVGCATSLIDPDNAHALYPPDPGQPIMRATQVRFRRIPSDVAPGIDDREFQGAELVALEDRDRPGPGPRPVRKPVRRPAGKPEKSA